jgi:riboflavin kinase / FMN adenylyltransferase
MKIIRHLRPGGEDAKGCAVTLGNFDGVHLGHREVLRRLLRQSGEAGIPSVAITFHPHPSSVLVPARAPLQLTDLRQRLRRLAETGVEKLLLQRFSTRFSELPADRFVMDFLVRGLRARAVVIGRNVGFGRKRAGDAPLLERLGREYGFRVEVVAPVEVAGRTVSSSAIRAAVAAGDLQLAEQMLGRPFDVGGRVVHGHHRGKALGIATANLTLSRIQLPPDGVYAVRVRLGERRLSGVANIGLNPTFGVERRAVETHIFDFEEEIYGQRVEVAFVERLRGEVKFPGVDALVVQIRRDIDQARRVLNDR